ncbi:Oidioi.mRNA.OKI2018_I69.PAR.g12717.t1.cds [Oikopleura dioica]|uniref:Oidioi.mRNA.OKI2018_I69.PAR.g12717.t1.cds n=1 Tax=Oikopleura dioica TaxID=34765 RepID=A0ABN7S4M8_OIKDI|nr:Oidioi.mRNA.OKI2018_I69.PAR.g12717.t1.cds [Oikopleura dioica]
MHTTIFLALFSSAFAAAFHSAELTPRHPRTVDLLEAEPMELRYKLSSYKNALYWCGRNRNFERYQECRDLLWDMKYIFNGNFRQFSDCKVIVRQHTISCDYYV